MVNLWWWRLVGKPPTLGGFRDALDLPRRVVISPKTDGGLGGRTGRFIRDGAEEAVFMHRVGRLKRQPDNWKDMFFPESQGVDGS